MPLLLRDNARTVAAAIFLAATALCTSSLAFTEAHKVLQCNMRALPRSGDSAGNVTVEREIPIQVTIEFVAESKAILKSVVGIASVYDVIVGDLAYVLSSGESSQLSIDRETGAFTGFFQKAPSGSVLSAIGTCQPVAVTPKL